MPQNSCTVKTVDKCGVLDFYKKRGFDVVKKEAPFYYLESTPSITS